MTSSSTRNTSTGNADPTPETIASYWKYFCQLKNDSVVRKLMLKDVRYVTEYKKYKKYFDTFCKIAIKYRISYVKYINYCINDLRIQTPKDLLSVKNLKSFAEYLNSKDYYYGIYKNYLKSANNVADSCIKYGYSSSSQYISDLIKKNLIAEEFITGRISRYYIATIQNFKKIYNFLDNINRDELHIIYDVCENLNQDVQDAFLMFKSQQVRPICFTDALIKEKKTKLTETN